MVWSFMQMPQERHPKQTFYAKVNGRGKLDDHEHNSLTLLAHYTRRFQESSEKFRNCFVTGKDNGLRV